MGQVTFRTNGQTLLLTGATNPAGTTVGVWSDSGLSSAVTLPATMTADTTYYLRDGETTITVTQPDGTILFSSPVTVGSWPREVTPTASAAQIASDISNVGNQIWVPATGWQKGATGSAVLTAAGFGSRIPSWSLDDTAIENVATTVYVPWPSWSLVQWWGSTSATSGDTVWACSYKLYADATDITGSELGLNAVTSTAPSAVNTIKAFTWGSPTGGAGVYHLRISRTANSGSDTMVGDAQFLGTMLVKA